MLLPGPIGGMLEQVGPQLRLFRLEPFEFGPDIGQAVSRVSILHLNSRPIIQETETRRDKTENRELRSGTPVSLRDTVCIAERHSSDIRSDTALTSVATQFQVCTGNHRRVTTVHLRASAWTLTIPAASSWRR